MAVCLTVQGEQPMSSATARISRGGPSEGPGGLEVGLCWAAAAPTWGGQWLGQGCPRERAGKARKRRGLGAPRTGVIGEDEEPLLVWECGSLMAMVVSIGSVK